MFTAFNKDIKPMQESASQITKLEGFVNRLKKEVSARKTRIASLQELATRIENEINDFTESNTESDTKSLVDLQNKLNEVKDLIRKASQGDQDSKRKIDQKSLQELNVLLKKNLQSLEVEKGKQARESEIDIEQEGDTNTAHYEDILGIKTYVCSDKKEISPLQTWRIVTQRGDSSGEAVVRFIKLQEGSSIYARPGHPLSTTGKHGNEILDYIDTDLIGRAEISIFNNILREYSQTISEYESLNPDSSDYNEKAKEIYQKIESFLDIQSLTSRISKHRLSTEIKDMEDFADRIRLIFKTQKYLHKIDLEEFSDRIKSADKQFKITPHSKKLLSQVSEGFNWQLGLSRTKLDQLAKNNQAPNWDEIHPEGLLVLSGEKGTGKNFVVDYYASITNRPVFTFVSSPDTTKQDLAYNIGFQNGETVNIPSEIIQAITTPNSMLILDEVNLLDPAIAKFLNTLFDGRRSLFANGIEIKAAPNTIIVGLINPSHYTGVQPLPETIRDRAMVMEVHYPPLRIKEKINGVEVISYSYDEALMVKDYIELFDSVPDQDYISFWNSVVNPQKETSFTKEYTGLEKKRIKQTMQDIKTLLMIIDKTREQARRSKGRDIESISLRGIGRILKIYSDKELWDEEKAIKYMEEKDCIYHDIAKCLVAEFIMPSYSSVKHTETYKMTLDSILNSV